MGDWDKLDEQQKADAVMKELTIMKLPSDAVRVFALDRFGVNSSSKRTAW